MLPFTRSSISARSSSVSTDGAAAADVRERRGGALWPTLRPSTRSRWPSGSSSSARPIPPLAPSELEPEARRARLFQSLRDLILARARRELMVLWLEDLHWLDPASEAALAMLTERPRDPGDGRAQVAAARDRAARAPAGWSATGRASLAGSRSPLEDSSTLLDDWLGARPRRWRRSARGSRRGPAAIPSSSRRSFARWSSAARCAASAAHIRRPPPTTRSRCPRPFRPSSRRASIGSHPRDKDVLQAAAVIGQDVPTELLRIVVDLPGPELDASLERLATAELLGPAEPSGECAFRHPLTQEVAYRTQLLDRRRRTHAAVARALLAIHGAAAADARRAPRPPLRGGWRGPRGRAVARAGGPARRAQRSGGRRGALPQGHGLARRPPGVARDADARAHLAHRAARDRPHRRHRRARGPGPLRRGPRGRRAPGRRAGHAFLLTSYGRLCGLAGDVAQYLACAERAAELAREPATRCWRSR